MVTYWSGPNDDYKVFNRSKVGLLTSACVRKSKVNERLYVKEITIGLSAVPRRLDTDHQQ